jgi:hypothetical protein
MKLSEIRPCDQCQRPLRTGAYAIDMSLLIVNPAKAAQAIGLGLLVGSMELADVMGSPDDVIVVAGDKEPSLRTRLLICQDCALEPLDLALLLEKEAARARR